MRKSLAVVAAVASLAVSPAPAQAQYALPEDGGTTSHDPYGYPSGPYPSGDPAPCQYEVGCEGPYQYLVPGATWEDAAAAAGGDVMQAGAVEESSAPVRAAAGDPEDAETFRGAIEAARAERAGGTPQASASEPAVEAAVEGGAPVGGSSGDAAVDTAVVQEPAAPVVKEEGVRPAAPVAESRPPEEDAAGEADRVEAAPGGGPRGAGGGSAALEVDRGSGGISPLALLGGGSALLVGTGLVLRRAIR